MNIEIRLDASEQLIEVLTRLVERVYGEPLVPETKSHKNETVKTEEPAPDPSEREEPKKIEQTSDSDKLLEDIRALIRQNARSHREEIKALLAEFNVIKASLLPAEVRERFYARLKDVLGA